MQNTILSENKELLVLYCQLLYNTLKYLLNFNSLYVCMCIHTYMYVHVDTYKGHNRVWKPLELELDVVVNVGVGN